MFNSDSNPIPTTNGKLPQLRLAVTSYCGRACVYCRPGGETFVTSRTNELGVDAIAKCVDMLSQFGLRHIKITGGEPLTRNDIPHLIRSLSGLQFVEDIELITRRPVSQDILRELKDNNVLNCLNFSLDTLDEFTWCFLNPGYSANDLGNLIQSIRMSAELSFKIKINMVVLKGINEADIPNMVDFVRELGGGTIKLLDLIDDIPDFKESSQIRQHSVSIEEIIDGIRNQALEEKTKTAPGGLGHPMLSLALKGNVEVLIKSANAGAFYGDTCNGCTNFPCHDALMALRLTPDGKLQRCLLRNDNLLDLHGAVTENNVAEINNIINAAITTYKTAEFYTGSQIYQLRKNKKNENI